jgi:type I restriction enzyme R subunit
LNLYSHETLSSNTFEREDGTPLHYTLINIKNWCKNSFEVVNQLRINTKNSFHRYDVTLLLNGSIKIKMLDVIVSKIPGFGVVRNNEKLHKTK